MELYNSLITEAKGYYEHLPQKVWDYDPRGLWPSNESSELVLQKDAAYELGASGKGSANFVLFTSNGDLVNKDQVILCGKDLGEIRGDCDFARIVLLRIGVLDDDDEAVYRTLRDIEFSKYASPRRASASRFASAVTPSARASTSGLWATITFRPTNRIRM